MSPSSLLYYVGLEHTGCLNCSTTTCSSTRRLGRMRDHLRQQHVARRPVVLRECAFAHGPQRGPRGMREPLLPHPAGPGPHGGRHERDRYFEEIMTRLETTSAGTCGPTSPTPEALPTRSSRGILELQRQRLRTRQHLASNRILETQNAQRNCRDSLRRPIDDAGSWGASFPDFRGSGRRGNREVLEPFGHHAPGSARLWTCPLNMNPPSKVNPTMDALETLRRRGLGMRQAHDQSVQHELFAWASAFWRPPCARPSTTSTVLCATRMKSWTPCTVLTGSHVRALQRGHLLGARPRREQQPHPARLRQVLREVQHRPRARRSVPAFHGVGPGPDGLRPPRDTTTTSWAPPRWWD